MVKIIDKPAYLTQEEKSLIDSNLLKGDFPWFYSKYMIENEDTNFFFFHYLYLRNDKTPDVESPPNSNFSILFKNIFERFCAENNVPVRIIHRACLNLVVCNGYKESVIHLDHLDFPHKNFILYLSDSPDYGTKIYDNDKKSLLYQSKGIQYNAIIFDGLYHSALIPTIFDHTRIVCVFTFN